MSSRRRLRLLLLILSVSLYTIAWMAFSAAVATTRTVAPATLPSAAFTVNMITPRRTLSATTTTAIGRTPNVHSNKVQKLPLNVEKSKTVNKSLPKIKRVEPERPKPKDKEHAPKPKDEEHAQKPKDKEHAPKPKDEEHAPKPKDKDPASKPNNEKHAPKPKDEKLAPKPKDEKLAPKPKDEEHAPKPEDKEHASKPKDEKLAPKPKDEKLAPKPKDEKHEPKPKDEKLAPKPKDEEHAPKPAPKRVRARRKIVKMPFKLTRIRSKSQAVNILIRDLDKFSKEKPSKIPRIIHQIYRDQQIPDVYAPYIQSWVKNNPDWEYWFWDDTSGPKFIRKHYPEFAPLYDAYCHDLMRSDALRYFILHKYGGIYADADYECYRSMEAKLNSSQCYLVQENWAQARLLYNTDLLVQNSFMASAPGHPFMNFVINNLPAAAPVKDCHLHAVLSATGPLLLDKCRKAYEPTCKGKPCQIKILPSDMMMPEYDTDNKGKPKFYRHKCGTRFRLQKLDPGGKKACKYFKDHMLGPPLIGPEVYASHKFLHIGNEAHQYKAKSYTNITKLVPEVFFPIS